MHHAQSVVIAALPLLEVSARQLPDGQSETEVWATNQVQHKLGAVEGPARIMMRTRVAA